MNVALSALIIILLLLPGCIFIKSYTSGLLSRTATRYVALEELLLRGALVYSMILHALAILVGELSGFDIRFDLLYAVVSGKEIQDETAASGAGLTRLFYTFVIYNLSLYTVSFGLAKVLRRGFFYLGFDTRYQFLKQTNFYYSLFTGRLRDSFGKPIAPEESDLVYLEVLTKTNVIYSGFLEHYSYSASKDDLENLILANARKKPFRIKKEDYTGENIDDPGFSKRVPGVVLIIRASEIVNISIAFVSVSDLDSYVPENDAPDEVSN